MTTAQRDRLPKLRECIKWLDEVHVMEEAAWAADEIERLRTVAAELLEDWCHLRRTGCDSLMDTSYAPDWEEYHWFVRDYRARLGLPPE